MEVLVCENLAKINYDLLLAKSKAYITFQKMRSNKCVVTRKIVNNQFKLIIVLVPQK